MSSETLNAIETTTQVAVENKPKKRGRKPLPKVENPKRPRDRPRKIKTEP